MKLKPETKEEMTAWLESKAAQYIRQHEFALAELFRTVKDALDCDIDDIPQPA
jgi:hypothetical protein